MVAAKYQLQSPKLMRKSVLTLVILLAGFCSSANAADQDLGARLKEHYRNHILALRHPFTARSQEYDSQGNSLTGGSEGPWTLFGRIDVTKMSVAPDYMQVEGDQVVFASDKRQGPLQPSRQHERVTIKIRLDHALASEEEATAILGRIFAQTPQDIVDSAPPLWQAYFAKEFKVPPTVKSSAQEAPGQHPYIDGAGKEVIWRLTGTEIIPPKPISTPAPEFPEFARNQKFEGVVVFDIVVDSSGNVTRIAVVNPVGMGLDEAAATKVSSWTFKPAIHDGHPVAAAFSIELALHP